MSLEHNVFIELALSPAEMFYFKQASRRIRELIEVELVDRKKSTATVTDCVVARNEYSTPNKRGVLVFYGDPMRWVIRLMECRDNPVPRADITALTLFRDNRKLNWDHGACHDLTFKGKVVEDGAKSNIKICMSVTHKPGWSIDMMLALNERFGFVSEFPIVIMKDLSGEERSRVEALAATLEFRLVFRPGNFNLVINQDVPGVVEDLDYLHEQLQLTYDPSRNSGYTFIDTAAAARTQRAEQARWEERYVEGLRRPVGQVVADGGARATGFWPVYSDGSVGKEFISLAGQLGAQQAITFDLINKVGKYMVDSLLAGRQVAGESNVVDQRVVQWLVRERASRNLGDPSAEWLAAQLCALHADFDRYLDEYRGQPVAANITYTKFWEMRLAGNTLRLGPDGIAVDFGIPGPGDQLSGADMWGDPLPVG